MELAITHSSLPDGNIFPQPCGILAIRILIEIDGHVKNYLTLASTRQ